MSVERRVWRLGPSLALCACDYGEGVRTKSIGSSEFVSAACMYVCMHA